MGKPIQDEFLNALRKDKITVSIYLISGIKLEGVIESFDQFAIEIKNSVSQIIYKHAIATVIAGRVPNRDRSHKKT